MIPIGDLPVLLGHARTLLPLLAAGAAARLADGRAHRVRLRAARRLASPAADRRAGTGPGIRSLPGRLIPSRAEGAPGPTGRAAPAVRTGGSTPRPAAAGAAAAAGTIRERNRANGAIAKFLTVGARR